MIYPDTVELKPRGVDEWGAPLPGGLPVPLPALVEKENRLVRDRDGKERVAFWNVFIPAHTAVVVAVGDFLSILRFKGQPSGDTRSYEVVSVYIAGGATASHLEIVCA